MKYFLFICLKFTSAASKTICKHFCSFLGLRHQHKYMGRAFMGTDMSEERSPNHFFSSTPQNQALKGSRFQQRHIYKCGFHNVFRSSWQSFWVTTAIQLQPFFFAPRTSFSKCDYEKHHLHSHRTCISFVCRPERGKYPQKWVCKKCKRLTHLRGRVCIHACIWKSAPCV